MKQYLQLLQHVLDDGEERGDRTGTGTLSVFGAQTKYDLRAGFPLVTTKKVLFPAVVRELLWFLRGSTNVHDDLTQHTPIWDAWADANGDLGPIYGYQWRSWGRPYDGRARTPELARSIGESVEIGKDVSFDDDARDSVATAPRGIDQIAQAITQIKTTPESRRIIVSAWNVGDLDKMALPPCHTMFQFYVSRSGRLDCQLYQRSADLALGVPFNIASYALLLMMVAQECDLQPGIFCHTLGDAHIYRNHVAGVRKQLKRTPKPPPRVTIADKPFDALRFEDIQLHDYEHHKFIKFPIAV